jgi:hypothetical protein
MSKKLREIRIAKKERQGVEGELAPRAALRAQDDNPARRHAAEVGRGFFHDAAPEFRQPWVRMAGDLIALNGVEHPKSIVSRWIGELMLQCHRPGQRGILRNEANRSSARQPGNGADQIWAGQAWMPLFVERQDWREQEKRRSNDTQ